MTTLPDVVPATGTESDDGSVDVFGVPWPAHKFIAVVAAAMIAGIVFVFTGSGEATMWASGSALLIFWWGGYRLMQPRWDHGGRDFFAENRSRH